MVRILGFFAIFLVLSFPLPAMAARNAAPTDRPPDQGGYTRAMGIPSLFKNTVGLEYLSYHTTSDHALGALVTAGTTRYIGSPVVGILGLGLEGYLGGHASETDAGGRAYLTIPSLLIGAGVDYSATSHESDLVLKLDVPARRKGIIGSGSAVTLRWLPHREQTFAVGLNIPIGDRNAGRTRPQSDYVKMDNREPARLRVGAAVHHRVAHPLQRGGVAGVDPADDSGDSTHPRCPSPFRPTKTSRSSPSGRAGRTRRTSTGPCTPAASCNSRRVRRTARPTGRGSR